MKKLLLALLVAGFCLTAHAQGTVNFSNFDRTALGPNAPVYETDGVTPLFGPLYMAELLAGALANNLTPVASIGFRTGNQAGYFFGGTQTINGVGYGEMAYLQVDVWNTAHGASFDQAQASGLPNSWWQSSLFTEQLGGGFQNFTPAALTGLGTSPVFLNPVPEPSTLGLAPLGLAIALLCSSKKR